MTFISFARAPRRLLIAACRAGFAGLLAGACSAAPAEPARVAACEARSGPVRTTVVELYTSEGCSSCPPADRWLSARGSTNAGPDPLLALAFHVTYWDRLGWADRFASLAHDERQSRTVAAQGGRVVYTPQVMVNGIDWRGWPRLPKEPVASPVDLHLSREGATFTARVASREIAERGVQQLSGYWALLEDGHRTEVRAGENAGTHLRHDHVVRGYQPVGAWTAGQERSLQWQRPEIKTDDRSAPSARRVAFVVVDARTQRPLQALSLAC